MQAALEVNVARGKAWLSGAVERHAEGVLAARLCFADCLPLLLSPGFTVGRRCAAPDVDVAFVAADAPAVASGNGVGERGGRDACE